MYSQQTIFKKFIKYLIPSVSAMIFFSIYTMVDGMFVGKGVGPDALAAVNTAMPFINLIFALSLMLSVGASTWISYYLGKGDKQKADEFFTLNTVAILVIGIFVSLVSLVFLEPLVSFLGGTPETFQYVKDYLKIIMSFSSFFMVAYALEVMVKADGFPQYSILYVSLAAGLNVVLDYLLVIHFDYGIKGAAYATGISQLISCMAFLSHFLKGHSNLRFRKINFSLEALRQIIKTGLPEALTELSLGFTTFAFNYVIVRLLGASGLAAFGVLMYVNNLVVMCAIGINQAMQPLISYYKGKNDHQTVKVLFKIALKTAALFAIGFLLISQLFTGQIVRLFINPSEIEPYGLAMKGLKYFSYGFVFSSVNILISGYFTANHMPKSAGFISLMRGYILVAVALMIAYLVGGADSVWIAPLAYEGFMIVVGAGMLWKLHGKNKICAVKNQEKHKVRA